MKQKQNYAVTIEEQIDDWHKEIQKFRVIAEVADKDKQIQHYRIIEDIMAKEQAVTDKLKELKECSDDRLEYIKDEIDAAQKRVTKAIESARTKIN